MWTHHGTPWAGAPLFPLLWKQCSGGAHQIPFSSGVLVGDWYQRLLTIHDIKNPFIPVGFRQHLKGCFDTRAPRYQTPNILAT